VYLRRGCLGFKAGLGSSKNSTPLNKLLAILYTDRVTCSGAQTRGAGMPDCSPSNPSKPKFKKAHFVDIMIREVLRDFPFSPH
jgi:hypothetical protein